ncbi:MAG: 3-deoxy-manno-octulosonate cytidylyltransferase [Gammaproteobacteria bacterium HGW-Gammaproteobacteria-14]|nr:MAG: 3-deoxy-manno-octulosonate cytidylyltransferase [Gammaproteobacteria bacterium HGW-Gammaproteobacteria-14]
MSYTVVIPARFSSTRLPGKPLAEIAGLPMVVRVMQRCQQSSATAVYVATDHQGVADVVVEHGGNVLMTRDDHLSGTDRLQEVAEQLALKDDDIIVNVQGDEPLIPPSVIDQVAVNLQQNLQCGMATLCEPITTRDDVFNPNIVKVVMNRQGMALYFSRAPIPWHRDSFSMAEAALPVGEWWRHIGIYGYRVGLLNQFVRWPAAELERIESLEQLRAMANGVAIHVAPAIAPVPGGIDTDADLQRVRALLS